MTLPEVTAQGVTLPEVSLPELTLPEVSLPEVTPQGVTLPGVTLLGGDPTSGDPTRACKAPDSIALRFPGTCKVLHHGKVARRGEHTHTYTQLSNISSIFLLLLLTYFCSSSCRCNDEGRPPGGPR